MVSFTGNLFIQPVTPILSILIGVSHRRGFGPAAYPLWSFGVMAVGAALGFMMLGELGVVLNFQETGVICWEFWAR